MRTGYEGDSFQIEGSGKAFKDYLGVILARKWIVLLISLIVTAGTVYYVRTLPPVYEATAILMHQSDNMSASMFGAMDPYYNLGYLSLSEDLRQLMGSRSVAAEVVKRLSEEWNIECEMDEVRGSVSLANPGGTNIFEIKTISGESEKAAALANAAARVFIEKTAEMKNSDLERAVEFLSGQIDLTDEKLRQSEQKLNAFREEEGIVIRADSSGYGRSSLLSQLGRLQEELNWARSEKELVRAQLDSVNHLIAEKKSQLALTEEIDLLVGSVTPQIEQLQAKIADWQLELTAMQETFTDKHYKVIELKQRIAEAQQRLRSEVADLVKANSEETSVDPISEWENLIQQAVQLYVQLQGYEHREELAASKIEKFEAQHPDLLEKEVQLVRLEREARIREKTYMSLMDRYEEMLLLKEVSAQEFNVVDNAIPPRRPVSPKKMKVIMAGVLIGLILGIAGAFFLEYMDDTIKQKRDVERHLGMDVVGLIPKIQVEKAPLSLPEATTGPVETYTGDSPDSLASGSANAEAVAGKVRKLKRRQRKHLEVLQGRLLKSVGVRSATAESYRSLWTNIQYASLDQPVKTILVTSPGPREGKSLTVANLAVVIAHNGARVLVIDADLRRPTVHRLFGYRRSPGLSELMASDLRNMERIVRNTYSDNLYILTSGDLPPNPVGLLGSEKMKQLIEQARNQYDIVLFDSSPLIAVSDASVLATGLDATLLVLRVGQTKRQVANQARELLERLNIKVFGAVLNNIDYSKRYGDYYYYYYHYQSYYGREEKDEIG